MKNMFSIIQEHNVKIFCAKSNEKHSSSRRNTECCPVERLKECMIYEAKVTIQNNLKLYYLTCEGEVKSPFYNHTKSFLDRVNETNLSMDLW